MGRGFSVRPLERPRCGRPAPSSPTLEGLALELSRRHPARPAGSAGRDRPGAGRTRGDVGPVHRLDEEWHRTLLQGCPNQRLRAMISTLWQVPRRYMRAYLREPAG